MKVFIYCMVGFPNSGMASGNRILHLAKASQYDGSDVVVLTPYSDSGKREEMNIDGVRYVSLCDYSHNVIVRKLNTLILFPLRAILFIGRTTDCQRILFGCLSKLEYCTTAWAVAKITHSAFGVERCEYPNAVLARKGGIGSFFEVNLMSKLFAGVVYMTEPLRDFYQKYVRRNCRFVHMPMTVDWNKFADEKRDSPFPFDYIAYTGAMRREGGGVDILVKSFALIAARHPELHLVLIGDGNDDLQRMFGKLAGAASDRVHCIFGGKVPRDEMPRYISNAKILAMLPLPTFQQQGCFPTKLGEYLSSGVPTVITKVGNPVQYLTDNENVFYVPPNDEQAAAAKLEEILGDYPKAQAIGRNGQQFAREHFHYANFSKRLVDFYSNICNA